MPDETPARIYAATLAFASWLGDHEDLIPHLDSAQLSDAERGGGYDVHLTVYGLGHDPMQAVADRVAAAIGSPAKGGYPTTSAHSTWQWSLRAEREYAGVQLRWAATIVCRRPTAEDEGASDG